MIWTMVLSRDGDLHTYNVWQGDEYSQLPEDMERMVEGEISFPDYRGVVTYFKSLEGDHQVFDFEHDGIIKLHNGEVESIRDSWGSTKKLLNALWLGAPDSDDAAGECGICRGGGCIACKPEQYI